MFYAAGEAAVATATTQEVNPIPHALPLSLLLDHILLQPDSSEPVGGGSGVAMAPCTSWNSCSKETLLIYIFAAHEICSSSSSGRRERSRGRGRPGLKAGTEAGAELGQHDEFVQRQWALKLHAH